MKQESRHTLKRRIFIRIMVTTTTCLLIMLLSFAIYSHRIIFDQTESEMIQRLTIITQKMDMLRSQVENTAILVLTNDEVQAWLEEVKDLEEYNIPTYQLSDCLYTIARQPYVSNIVIYPLNYEEKRFNLFSYACQQDVECVAELLASNQNCKWNINNCESFMIPRVHGEGSPILMCYYQKVYSSMTMELLGVVEIMVNESRIASIYQGVSMGENGVCFFLDEDGSVVSAQDKTQLGIDYSDLLRDNSFDKNINGIRMTILTKSYLPFKCTIVGAVPVSVFSSMIHKCMVFAIILGILMMLVVFCLSQKLAYSLSQPILQLKNAMTCAGKGERLLNLEMNRGDEIGDLNREFSVMLAEMDRLNGRVREEFNKKREIELALILSQMSPHFLYNSLECIRGLSAMGRNDDVDRALTALSRFYRTIFSAKNQLTTIRNELDMARSYLKIMHFRYPDKLEYSIDYDEDILDCFVVNMALQPILENAIVHGLRNSRNMWRVEIKAYIEENDIFLSVWDNGIGMSEKTINEIFNSDETVDSRIHFGIRATDERIRQICGEKYRLQVYSALGKGTMIVASFPSELKEGYSNV